MTIPAPAIHAFYYPFAIHAFDEAASLFYQREYKLNRFDSDQEDIAAIDGRLTKNFQHLFTLPEAAQGLCHERFEMESADDAFVGSCAAFIQGEPSWIQEIFTAYLNDETCHQAITKALAWLPWQISGPWVERFLKSHDLAHKKLGVSVCCMLSYYPKQNITHLIQREDCQEDTALLAQLIYLIGQMRDTSLLPLIVNHNNNEDSEVKTAAFWARLILGDTSISANAMRYSLEDNDTCAQLAPLLVRILPLKERRSYLSALLNNTDIALDLKITVVGYSGDPKAIPWLIPHMENPLVQQRAGFAFSYITGIDLAQHNLAIPPAENDELEDADDELFFDIDDSLPLPNAEKIKALWQQHHARFSNDYRYFRGTPIARNQNTLQHLMKLQKSSNTKIQHHAHIEHALLDPKQTYTSCPFAQSLNQELAP